MSVYFAMIAVSGEQRPAFFLTRDAAPDDAVAISERRHAKLLDAQSEGREIGCDGRGRPIVLRRRVPDLQARRARLRAAIRAEASRRIRTISPEWRQLNDLRDPTEAGRVRFTRIDAVRAAEGAIGSLADACPPTEIDAFRIGDHPLWPEFDDA